jgi:hypothetical protein
MRYKFTKLAASDFENGRTSVVMGSPARCRIEFRNLGNGSLHVSTNPRPLDLGVEIHGRIGGVVESESFDGSTDTWYIASAKNAAAEVLIIEAFKEPTPP